MASSNIGGGKLFHILSGNLSQPIEHHVFPNMCGNRYPEVAPRVRAGTAQWSALQHRLAGAAVRHDDVDDLTAGVSRWRGTTGELNRTWS